MHALESANSACEALGCERSRGKERRLTSAPTSQGGRAERVK